MAKLKAFGNIVLCPKSGFEVFLISEPLMSWGQFG
jgi:hypothetical protein